MKKPKIKKINKKANNFIIIFLILFLVKISVLFLFIVSPRITFGADINLNAQTDFAGIKAGQPLPTLDVYFAKFYQYAMWAGGSLAVLLIIWAGFQRVISNGDSKKVNDSQDQIWAALTGITLLATSYAILNFINPALVQNKLITVKVVNMNTETPTPNTIIKDYKDASDQNPTTNCLTANSATTGSCIIDGNCIEATQIYCCQHKGLFTQNNNCQ